MATLYAGNVQENDAEALARASIIRICSAEVDEAYERCLSIGARIRYPPKQDRDLPDYYELFVFDPDGFASRSPVRRPSASASAASAPLSSIR